VLVPIDNPLQPAGWPPPRGSGASRVLLRQPAGLGVAAASHRADRALGGPDDDDPAFEKALYDQIGVDCRYVGHPNPALHAAHGAGTNRSRGPCARRRCPIGLLPGSRAQEIPAQLPDPLRRRARNPSSDAAGRLPRRRRHAGAPAGHSRGPASSRSAR